MNIIDDEKEAQDKITYILGHTKSKKTLQNSMTLQTRVRKLTFLFLIFLIFKIFFVI